MKAPKGYFELSAGALVCFSSDGLGTLVKMADSHIFYVPFRAFLSFQQEVLTGCIWNLKYLSLNMG